MSIFPDARFKLDGYCFDCGRRYLSEPDDEDLCPKCRAIERRTYKWYNWYGQNEVFLDPPDTSQIFESGFCDRCGSLLFDVEESHSVFTENKLFLFLTYIKSLQILYAC